MAFFYKSVFLYTKEEYVPPNGDSGKDILERAQRSGDSIIYFFLFLNIGLQLWKKSIKRNEIVSLSVTLIQ
jgi:hypothetical protein